MLFAVAALGKKHGNPFGPELQVTQILSFKVGMKDIAWKLPWRAIQFKAEIPGVQNQLELEITKVHPLYGMAPAAEGRRVDCDDVLARLNDGSYVNVHLVWGSGPGAFPEQYPSFIKYEKLQDFIASMELDSLEYEE